VHSLDRWQNTSQEVAASTMDQLPVPTKEARGREGLKL